MILTEARRIAAGELEGPPSTVRSAAAENWVSGSTVVYAIDTSYDADNEVTSQSDPDSSSRTTTWAKR